MTHFLDTLSQTKNGKSENELSAFSVPGTVNGARDTEPHSPIKYHPYLRGMPAKSGPNTQKENMSGKQGHRSDGDK